MTTRRRWWIAASAAVVIVGAAAVLAVRTVGGPHPLKAPRVTAEQDDAGLSFRWRNPSGGADYDPLDFKVIVYTRDGRIQSSYFSAEEDRAPGCCSVSAVAGHEATTHIPQQRRPVGNIEFVDLHTGRSPHWNLLPDLTCDFTKLKPVCSA